MTEVLQSSLFGYSKKSVAAYIAGLNEECAKKILEKELEYKRSLQELQEQIQVLQGENEALRAERQKVAGALIDAKTFAADLMAREEAESAARRTRSQADHEAELQRLSALAADISALREAFRGVLTGMDGEMERYELQCQAARSRFDQEMADAARAHAPGGGEHEDRET